MANEATVIVGKLDDKALRDSIDSLVKYVQKNTNKMATDFDSAIKQMQQSLKDFGNTKISTNFKPENGSSARANAQKTETDAVRETTSAYDKQADAMQKSIADAKKYSDEIMQQAKAIRESNNWIEKGYATVGNFSYYDPDRSSMPKKLRKSLEDQISDSLKEQGEIEQRNAREAEKERREREAELGVIRNQVVAEQQITQTQQQRNTNGKPKTFSDYSDLRAAVASVLNIQQEEVILANEETASYNKLSQTLKQLQSAYNKLNAEQRNSDNGVVLSEEINRVSRAISKIQQQASRPTNLKAVMGLDEKTLDDISYKMQQLARYRSGIDTTDSTKAKEIKDVNEAYARLQKRQQEILGQNKSMLESNNALTRSFNYMKNRLAFYFTVGASTQFVKQIYDIRSQYELLERSIGILIDNMQKGSQIFAELNSMAIKSPFTTMELGAAAKQLVAYDVAAEDVVDTTKRLADMAAAVGIPIERLTYALGQIKSYGYLNARDARMFANAGIPLVRELAERYTELEGRLVSTADVYDRIKKKAISYNDVMETVNKMTDEGGKFFNFQEKAADTMKVRLANLTLAYNNMLNEMGKANQSALTQPLVWIKTLFEHWKNIDNAIYAVITTLGLYKAMQAVLITQQAKRITLTELEILLGKKLTANIARLAKSIKALDAATMFASAIKAAVTVAVAALAYLGWQYYDLVKANDEFNKSIKKNADENINSIDKFFGDYKDQLKNINGSSIVDQQKMWERIQEEIKKSAKNAEGYIDNLEKIQNISSRIDAATNVLEQTKEISDEIKMMSERGAFNIGGGFANDSAAKDIAEYEKSLNGLLEKYGTLEEAQKRLANSPYATAWTTYTNDVRQAESELQKFISNLEKADLDRIMGSGNEEERLANLRQYTEIIRDNFLATEEGQKIGTQGQAKLNSELDKWIAKQGIAKNVLSREKASIEENKTAWQTFFNMFSSEDRKRVDYMIRTNKTGSDDFKKIWDSAAQNMAKRAAVSYDIIKNQIENLRNEPDIVLNIVYRERKENLDAQMQNFADTFLEPEASDSITTVDEYLKKKKELNEKYGRFQRKEDEDNVEWEKRLGEEYQNNISSIETLNAQLKNRNNLGKVDIDQKEKERNALVETNKALDDIAKKQNFNYEQFKKGGKGSQKDALGEALAKEVEIITNMQKRFKEYRSEGVSAQDAVTKATDEYGKTLKLTNDTLAKFGVSGTKTGKELASMRLRDLRDYFVDMLSEANRLGNSKGIEALEKAIANINVEINKVDYKKLTEGLNNELSKLKDEYELSVELGANPEMGDMFMNMFDIDPNALPQTIDEYAERVLQRLNNYLKNEEIELPSLNLTDDDLNAFRDMMYEGFLSEGAFKYIESQVKELRELRKKDAQDTMNEWQSLIEKYGDLQSKLIKIYKDSTQEQMSIVKKFGSDEQIKESLDVVRQINISEDPAEITRLQGELAKVLSEVVKNNPLAKKALTASLGGQESGLSKAYWDDFKDSDLYTMTFEDMSNNSTRAIQLIIDKLDELKDKVKEDPASMKALMKSFEDARKELESRSSTVTIVDALKEMRESATEVDVAMRNLASADREVQEAEAGLDLANRFDDTSKLAEATERLRIAREKQKKAEEEAAKAESKYRKSLMKLKSGFDVLSSELQNVQGIFGAVADLFAKAGDEDTAEAISAINDGFSVMITVITGVIAVMTLLETTQPYLLAIAAALSIIVGLVSFLSGRSDKKIVKQIEESERAVKRLELSYKALQYAIEDAYGTAKYSLEQLSIINKKMELEEIQRQLSLEQQRTGKHRDEDKIIELQGKELELQNEINKAIKDMANDMLGISNVGDAAERLVSSMIDAFKDGEDYMLKFSESFEDMIDNMVMKAIVSRVIGERLQSVFDMLEQRTQSRTEGVSNMMDILSREREQIDKELAEKSKMLANFKNWGFKDTIEGEIKTLQNQRASIEEQLLQQQKMYEEAMRVTPTDVQDVRDMVDGFKGNVEEEFKMWMDMFGITFGQNNANEKAGLSALQQGIQSVTETTANAIEGYMNSISQQAYLRNELLTEIRDALVYVDSDLNTSVQAQMLLQLQNSYAVQMTIQNLLEGWSNANGQAVRVELI